MFLEDLRLMALYETLLDNIECNSNKVKDLEISEDEEIFIKELLLKCDQVGMSGYLKLERLSDKTFNVWCNCYVGKINLRDERTFMQYTCKNGNIKVAENKYLPKYLKLIEKWIKYIES